MKKIPIIFSTITGNAFKLAEAVAPVVPEHVGPYNIRYITDEVIERFDTFVLSYWCNHGTADDDTIELIGRMKGKNLIVIACLREQQAARSFSVSGKHRSEPDGAAPENSGGRERASFDGAV